MQTGSLWVIRPEKPEDWSFIRAAWTESYRRSRHAGCIPAQHWRQVMDLTLEHLKASGLAVLLAVDPEDPDHLLGFLAHTGNVVHYAYVKEPLRRNGICRALLSHIGLHRGESITYTFHTNCSTYFHKRRHMPQIARNGRDGRKED